VLLVGILAILPLGIVWFAYVTSGSTLDDVQGNFARSVYRTTTEDIAALTAEYMMPISMTADRAAAQLSLDVFDPELPDAVDTYLWTVLEHDPRITFIAWYRADGVIHQAARNGTQLVSSRFDPNVDEPAVTTTWRTLSGTLVRESVDDAVLEVSDPLLLVESQVHGTAVSDPVRRASDGAEPVAFAVTAPGPIAGTVFVETDLRELGSFLGEMAPTTSSRVFVVADDSRLVTHSRPEVTDDAPAGTDTSEITDTPTNAAATRAAGGEGWEKISIDEQTYHTMSLAVDVPGVDWSVVAVGPESDFSGQFRDQRLNDTIKLAMIGVSAIFLAIPIARLAVRDMGTLHSAAHKDSLTGLVNRRTFEKHGATMVAAARRRRRSVGALMIDIDHFKQLNDTYGHHAGDEVLEAVAGRIAHSVAKTDLVARLGGDEMALLLEGADLAASQSVAARLKNAVTATPISTNRGPIYVTVSIGASATGGTDRARLEDVLKAADRALYASKRAGRDRITAVQVARTH
jgi:diguanylate cyclase (GGDEF)-like protein